MSEHREILEALLKALEPKPGDPWTHVYRPPKCICDWETGERDPECDAHYPDPYFTFEKVDE